LDLHHLADNLLFAQFTGAGLVPLFSGHPGSPLENIAIFPRFNRTDHNPLLQCESLLFVIEINENFCDFLRFISSDWK
jgi:hypothetical protein